MSETPIVPLRRLQPSLSDSGAVAKLARILGMSPDVSADQIVEAVETLKNASKL